MDRLIVAALIEMNGGMRAVAREADLRHSNISNWCSGHPSTLSDASVARLLDAVGATGFRPASDRVLIWRPRLHRRAIYDALKWVFPDGARAAKSDWSVVGRRRAAHYVRLQVLPELYAIWDGTHRVLIRMPAGLFADPTKVNDIDWIGNREKDALLRIDREKIGLWTAGQIRVEAFDAALPTHWAPLTDVELIQEIRKRDLTNEDVLRRLDVQAPLARRRR